MNILNINTVADQLNVRPSCLARWRVTGGGPRFVKLGKRVGYRQEDIDAWIENNVCSSTSEAA